LVVYQIEDEAIFELNPALENECPRKDDNQVNFKLCSLNFKLSKII
jgi:hypothetical protein